MRRLVTKSGLDHVRFHDMRHTHATQLLRAGVAAKVVSDRLGHANIAITLDIYSHVLPDMQTEAAERIDGVLKKAMGDDDAAA
jgi:integrase